MKGEFLDTDDTFPAELYSVAAKSPQAVREGTVTLLKPAVLHRSEDGVVLFGLICGAALEVSGFNHVDISFTPELFITCPCWAPAA